MSIVYVLAVDFDDDGSFATAGDDITADQRGRAVLTRGRSRSLDFRPPVAGTAELMLDNRSGDYDAGGTLTTDLPLQVTANPNAGGAVAIWQGYTQRLVQHPSNFYPTVSLSAYGPFAQLVGRKVSTALYEGITTDVAIGHVLDAASFPAGDRALQTGRTTLDWFWVDDEDAFAVLRRLLATEGPGAQLVEGIDGAITFLDRHYVHITSTSTAAQSTIRGTGTEPVMSEFEYDDGRDRAVGEVLIQQRTRSTAAALSVIWSFSAAVSLGPSQSRKFTIRATDRTPFSGLLDPVAGTDYTLVSGAVSSATFDRSSGGNATLTITATSAGCSLTGLQARGYLVSVDADTLVASSITPTNADAQSYTPSTVPEISYEQAKDLADGYMEWHKNGPPELTVTLLSRSSTSETAQTARDIAERVNIIETTQSINVDAYIMAVQHRYGGRLHSATYTCEQVPGFSVFILDTSTLDGTDVLWI